MPKRINALNYTVTSECVFYFFLVTTPGEDTWSFSSRYSELRSLNRILKKCDEIKSSELPPFPPKHLFGWSKDSEFLKQRHAGLETYLNNILYNIKLAESGVIRKFFAMKNPYKNGSANNSRRNSSSEKPIKPFITTSNEERERKNPKTIITPNTETPQAKITPKEDLWEPTKVESKSAETQGLLTRHEYLFEADQKKENILEKTIKRESTPEPFIYPKNNRMGESLGRDTPNEFSNVPFKKEEETAKFTFPKDKDSDKLGKKSKTIDFPIGNMDRNKRSREKPLGDENVFAFCRSIFCFICKR